MSKPTREDLETTRRVLLWLWEQHREDISYRYAIADAKDAVTFAIEGWDSVNVNDPADR
jgi:hypothetical protein